MKIIRLTAENLLRLRAVEITPDGSTVVISGRNGQGKTSVLNAISFALGGAAAAKDADRPVRDGEDHARVVLDLGDIVVTRRWNAEGASTLHIESGDGAQVFRSPQKMLDELIGRLSFDPLAFANQPPRDQLVTLLDLVELPWDPAELAASRQAIFDERTVVNRDVKALRAQVDALPPAPADLPDAEVSAGDLLAEYRAAEATVNEHAALRAAAVTTRERVVAETSLVEQLTEQLRVAKESLAESKKVSARADRAASTLPDDPDLSAYEARLDDAEEINRKVREAQSRAGLVEQLDAALAESARLTTNLEMIDATKAEDLAAADMPIDGLAFDDDGVTYQGVPFGQASAAEKLRVSIAMAMAMNPKLRVIRITDGSLLDSDNMALIEEMAGEHDFQVWIERVTDGDGVGVVIEDGLVLEATS